MNINELHINLYANSKTMQPSIYEEGIYKDVNKKLNGRYKIYNETSNKYYWIDESDWNRWQELEQKTISDVEGDNTLSTIYKIQETTQFNKTDNILYKIIHKTNPTDTPESIAKHYGISIDDVIKTFNPNKRYNIITAYNNVI